MRRGKQFSPLSPQSSVFTLKLHLSTRYVEDILRVSVKENFHPRKISLFFRLKCQTIKSAAHKKTDMPQDARDFV